MIERTIFAIVSTLLVLRIIAVAVAASANRSSKSERWRSVGKSILPLTSAAAVSTIILVVGFALTRTTMPLLHLISGFAIALGIQVALWATGIMSPFVATDVLPPGVIVDVVSSLRLDDRTEASGNSLPMAVNPRDSSLAGAQNLLSGDWTSFVYSRFVRRNIEYWQDLGAGLFNLSRSNKVADPTAGTEYRLGIPAGEEMVDVLLSQMLDGMADGDHCSIANTNTWTRLPNLRKAQDQAIRRHVRVRQILALGKPEEEHNLQAVLSELRDRRKIYEKNRYAYEVRIMDLKAFERFSSSRVWLEWPLWMFVPGDREQSVVVFLENQTFSALRVAGTAAARRASTEFDRLWEGLPVIEAVGESDKMLSS